jgi:hypothetical protein
VQNTVARRRSAVGAVPLPESYVDEEGGYSYPPYPQYSNLYNGYTYENEALVRSREYKVARRARRPSFERESQSASNGWMTTCLFCLILVMIAIIVTGTLYMTQLSHATTPIATTAPTIASITISTPFPPLSPPSEPPNPPNSLNPLNPTIFLDRLLQRLQHQEQALERLNWTLNAHINTHASARVRASNRTH